MNPDPTALNSHRPQLIRRVLASILILGFISGAISGYYEASKSLEPMWSDFTSTIIILFLILTWYHIDSNAHEYKRSIWLNILIIGFALIGVPYYLIRSRAPGKRFHAIALLLSFAFLFIGVSMVGEYLMIWVA
jgi:hypothetical protein